MSLYVIVAVRKEPLSGHVAYVRWGRPSAACRLGQRAGHGGRVGSHRADPAGGGSGDGIQRGGHVGGIAAGARADRRRGPRAAGLGAGAQFDVAHPVRLAGVLVRRTSARRRRSIQNRHCRRANLRPNAYLVAVERGAQVPAPAARHQDGLAGAGMPEGEQPEGAFRSDRLQVVRADHQPVRPRGRAQRPAQCDRQEGEARRGRMAARAACGSSLSWPIPDLASRVGPAYQRWSGPSIRRLGEARPPSAARNGSGLARGCA